MSETRICHGYEVLDKLGEGAFGKVYRVRKEGTTSPVWAMKEIVVDPQAFAQGFPIDIMIELEIMTNWNYSPYVVTAKKVFFTCERPPQQESDAPNDPVDSDDDTADDPQGMGLQFEGRLFIVMDLAQMNLAAWMARPRKQLSQFLQLSAEFIMGLDHFHSIGLVHLDIKPENILLFPLEQLPEFKRATDLDLTAKVADFGLSKWRRSDVHTASTGGTPIFMPPEALFDFRQSSQTQSDLWAIGCIFFEFLFGEELAWPFSFDPNDPDRKPLSGAAAQGANEGVRQRLLHICQCQTVSELYLRIQSRAGIPWEQNSQDPTLFLWATRQKMQHLQRVETITLRQKTPLKEEGALWLLCKQLLSLNPESRPSTSKMLRMKLFTRYVDSLIPGSAPFDGACARIKRSGSAALDSEVIGRVTEWIGTMWTQFQFAERSVGLEQDLTFETSRQSIGAIIIMARLYVHWDTHMKRRQKVNDWETKMPQSLCLAALSIANKTTGKEDDARATWFFQDYLIDTAKQLGLIDDAMTLTQWEFRVLRGLHFAIRIADQPWVRNISEITTVCTSAV